MPLIARLDPNALWLPRGQFDAVQWGPDFGEILRAGERLFSVEATDDAEPFVVTWAAAHDVPLSALEPAPLLR